MKASPPPAFDSLTDLESTDAYFSVLNQVDKDEEMATMVTGYERERGRFGTRTRCKGGIFF